MEQALRFGNSSQCLPFRCNRGESETVNKALPNEKAGILAGYFFQPGGQWRGSYKIIREDDLVAYLRGELSELSVVETQDVRFPEEVEFPLLDAAQKLRLEKLGGALQSTSLTLLSDDLLPPLPWGEQVGEASVPQPAPEAEEPPEDEIGAGGSSGSDDPHRPENFAA